MQRNKGKVGERELCRLLEDLGFPAHRGAQHRGGPASPDVVCEALSGVHVEVKRVQGMDVGSKLLLDAYEQAKRECGGKVPVVCWRPNRKAWRMTYESHAPIVLVTVSGDDIRHALLFLQQRGSRGVEDPGIRPTPDPT